ncbi:MULTISPECIES: hypothetical protein [Halobacillus]|uniref:hypothetical protein n=1 Tax=Halobacillus TaxID=45667 RepID=UPI0003F52B42|nr:MULTISPECIES: hypothetical protein [Halobacillus]
MDLILGAVLILWGVFILYASIFKMKGQMDYVDDTRLGSSGYLEWESVVKLLNKLPYPLAKSVVMTIGSGFILLGAWVI